MCDLQRTSASKDDNLNALDYENLLVYILKCSDESYYTGVTNCLERRLAEHTSGRKETSYTYSRRPVELVFSRKFKYVNDAIAFEKQVKGWSRKKKEAIING
ncbi:GIY-YIG nuclease family protein [Dyadobacter psychrophilus]|uniref:Putative endonuclease n=1 Tax=Dyadobacter psychrophilus TaxID=651661 RepID=A0A1T5H323_9BACT|nr:GIY-YIG nuclease family protein [Dyadobacter psychrophilus]SKC15074.1 putative endonuclease [Dyadobacter psychrophilus]